MPTIERNREKWDGEYDWSGAGAEWSAPWRTVDMQWHGALWPRIHNFVPTGTILEIAPGYGRWTSFLKDLCQQMIVVDLSARCIDACKQRFAREQHITYHQNDGKSLECVPDGSVNFVYSFDSLVHAEEEAIASYLAQLPRKMAPDGVGFIHHSNLGEYPHLKTVRSVGPLRAVWKLLGLGTKSHGRAFSMTATKFEKLAAAAGLQCISQEILNWRCNRLIDCITVFTPRGSKWSRPNRVLRNPHFMTQAKHIAELAELYSSRSAA